MAHPTSVKRAVRRTGVGAASEVVALALEAT